MNINLPSGSVLGARQHYIDLTDIDEESRPLAERIKQAVFDATGLTCSIAISPNKLLSKIGSDLDKPNGLTILDESDIEARIWPLLAKKINGIGPKATERLTKLGINTIGELAAADPAFLIRKFGQNTGAWLHRVAHGIDERPVVTYSEPKSISRETTLERDLHAKHDRVALSVMFTSLCERVADGLKRKGYVARTIGIKIRFEDFSTVTRDCTVMNEVSDAGEIRKAAGECLKRVSLNKRIRLLGVRASSLSGEIGEVSMSQAQGQFVWE